jgi:cephalosporin hydroxylase
MSKLNDENVDVPDKKTFESHRQLWRQEMGNDLALRAKAIELTILADKYKYGYQWEWCGIPVIKHPDDIVLLQEIIWNLQPSMVIETGVARGGSLVLSASLMTMREIKPRVLGIDVQIFPHTREALKKWIETNQVEILECDSSSDTARNKILSLTKESSSPVLLILDSNHSEEHVYKELQVLTPCLPIGSLVIVADTIIEEMPASYYKDRPWCHGDNPFSALTLFLAKNSDFVLESQWSKRSLMGECRDGIIRKTK